MYLSVRFYYYYYCQLEADLLRLNCLRIFFILLWMSVFTPVFFIQTKFPVPSHCCPVIFKIETKVKLKACISNVTNTHPSHEWVQHSVTAEMPHSTKDEWNFKGCPAAVSHSDINGQPLYGYFEINGFLSLAVI